MKKLSVILLSIILILSQVNCVFADEATTILLEANTEDYTYLTHPTYDESASGLIVSDDVTTIGDYTFFKDTSLETVELSSSVTSIGDYAFYECTNLKSIDLSNVEHIGKYAFYGCTSLTEVTFNGEAGAHALDFEGDNQLAFSMSLARVDAMINYLNEVYLTTDLGYEIDYCSPKDIEELQALADYITQNSESEVEKAMAIYDWVSGSISYTSGGGYSAIDVFRTGKAICSGYSQLTATLMKLSGIPCAITRALKEKTNLKDDNLGINVSLDYTYNRCGNYHEFVMAYVDDEWRAYDALWGYEGETNYETVAANYFVLHIDGIYAYSDEGFDLVKALGNYDTEVLYYDGDFHGSHIKNNSICKFSKLSVGGCLNYNRTFYTEDFSTRVTYYGDKENVIGYAANGGWYKASSGSEYYYIFENGVRYSYGIKDFGGTNYLFCDGLSIEIDDALVDIGLINGSVSMYVGEELDLADAGITPKIYESSDVVEIDGTTIKAIGTGKAEIRLCSNKVKCYVNFYVYGDITTSNDLFQELCDHDTTHLVNEVEYCDYCGAEVIEEEVVEEEAPIEEVKEETEEEKVEEVEEKADEVIEETPTQQVEPEETKEEVVENKQVEEIKEEVETPKQEQQVEEVSEEAIEKEQQETTPKVIEEQQEEQQVVENEQEKVVEEVQEQQKEIVEEVQVEQDVVEVTPIEVNNTVEETKEEKQVIELPQDEANKEAEQVKVIEAPKVINVTPVVEEEKNEAIKEVVEETKVVDEVVEQGKGYIEPINVEEEIIDNEIVTIEFTPTEIEEESHTIIEQDPVVQSAPVLVYLSESQVKEYKEEKQEEVEASEPIIEEKVEEQEVQESEVVEEQSALEMVLAAIVSFFKSIFWWLF